MISCNSYKDVGMILIFLFFLLFYVEAQETPPPTEFKYASRSAVHQGMIILVSIMSVIFFITFILVVHPRLCRNRSLLRMDAENSQRNELLRTIMNTRVTGLDKSMINSLPSFTFSSLKGSKDGLGCAVCLSIFEDSEVLRLLPKCKHAFHVICVDQWLENHPNCPLCRQKVEAEDITIFKLSSSSRFPQSYPDLSEEENVDLFVQREEVDYESTRLSIGDFSREEKCVLEEEQEKHKLHMHKFKHKIIVFGVVFNNRWSDVNSSDIISLSSHMLNSTSSKMFPSFHSESELYLSNILGTESSSMGEKRGNDSGSTLIPLTSEMEEAKFESSLRKLIPSFRRSISDSTTFSRFSDFAVDRKTGESFQSGNNLEQERMRLWLRIARKTVSWFAGKERSKLSQYSMV